jgi:hypothetical protein
MVEFTAMWSLTRALPLSTWGVSTRTQIALLRAVNSQFGGACTSMSTMPPFVPTSTDLAESWKSQTVGDVIALKIFSLPPLLLKPSNCASLSTEFIKVALSDAADKCGYWAAKRAAAPETCGADIDVPLELP